MPAEANFEEISFGEFAFWGKCLVGRGGTPPSLQISVNDKNSLEDFLFKRDASGTINPSDKKSSRDFLSPGGLVLAVYKC